MKIRNYINQIRKSKDNLLEINQRIATEVAKRFYTDHALTCKELGITKSLYCSSPIIVSLTTYGKRLQEVYLTIESLLYQTFKPNKIILCLSDEIEEEKIPEILNWQRERGLEIFYCKDTRSFTKLVPTLQKYPDAAIITVDDDIVYPVDFLEYLIKAYISNPNNVYFYYGFEMSLDHKKKPTSYNEWVKNIAHGASIVNLPTGVDGILYPPGCFYDDVCNDSIYLDLCPYADDLWFKAMTMLKGVKCEEVQRIKNPREEFIYIDSAADISLATVNRAKNMNDEQALRLFERYHLEEFFNEL